MSTEILGELKSTLIPINKLILNPRNTRLTHLSKIRTDIAIHNQIWKEQDTKDLYNQILAAKGIYEELVVDANNIVREGNRRLVCLRVLQKQASHDRLPGIKKTHFDNITCKILPKTATEKEIDLYLATIHVKGKKKWNAFNKAQLLHDLRHIHHLTDDKIQKQLSIGKITLNRAIEVFIVTKEYGKRYPTDKGWYHKFTYFDEFYKKRALAEFRKDPKNVIVFGDWLKKGKFHDVREVRILPYVLQNKHAMERFEDKNMTEARAFLEPRDPSMISREFNNIQKTINLLKYFPKKELIKTIHDKYRMAILFKLQQELNNRIEELSALKKTIKFIPMGS